MKIPNGAQKAGGRYSKVVWLYLNFSTFYDFVDCVRCVEHHRLQEEDKGHPLVVGLDRDKVLVVDVWPDTSSGNIFSNLDFEN